ncbi:MAG: DNA mismatch repair endonuclease MutL [Syntrophales bacterium]
MGRITVLSKELSDKIAAGEVVERPASVVKELLENALDAGADDVRIELEKGGKEAIRIVDNGTGMDSVDVPLAFGRHATSKIAKFEDLFHIRSFGFRGEALPSIAAVSRIELLSRTRDSVSGTRAIVENGRISEISEAGCPPGTSVIVKDLFETVPARRKFLKKDASEQAHCMEVVNRLAIANPHVKIRVFSGGKMISSIPATADPSERVSLVLGDDYGKNLIAVNTVKQDVHVSGFISGPGITRSNRRNIYLYVNRRYVKDSLISRAVINAYRGVIEDGRYPSAVLFVDLSYDDVDVNVHPAKMEIRFREPGKVYGAVLESLIEALAFCSMGQSGSGRSLPRGTGRMEPEKRYIISSGPSRPLFNRGLYARAGVNGFVCEDSEPFQESGAAGHDSFFSSLSYIGQIAGTYLIFSSGDDGMVMIDQHAAHERILFERLKKTAGSINGQRLLIPEVIQMSPAEEAALMDCAEILGGFGMEIGFLGGGTVVIKSIPDMISRSDIRTVIADIMAEISDMGKSVEIGKTGEKILAMISCKGAVKAHDALTETEVEQLCRDLDSTPFSSTCPHGRPVYIRFGPGELGRLFRRK